MPVDPAANALVTLARVKRYLEIESTDTSRDDLLNELINACSSAIENYCDRKFKSQTHTETLWGVNTKIFVKNYPITAITSVTEEGETSPIESKYYKNRETYIQLKDYSIDPEDDVTVVYVAGYAAIPEDLQFACSKLVDAYFKSDIADYSKTFEAGIVIRPEAIPGQVRALLDPYKKMRV